MPAELAQLHHAVDVNSLERRPASSLAMNEVGRVTLALHRPIAYDPYKQNRATGAFILIDRSSNGTVGAGMLLPREDRPESPADTWTAPGVDVPAAGAQLDDRGLGRGLRLRRAAQQHVAAAVLRGLVGADDQMLALAARAAITQCRPASPARP